MNVVAVRILGHGNFLNRDRVQSSIHALVALLSFRGVSSNHSHNVVFIADFTEQMFGKRRYPVVKLANKASAGISSRSNYCLSN